MKLGKYQIIKYASIYGANAAGKSNLIEVFNFVKYCITNALPSPAVEMFCKSKKENKEKESVFEFQFIIDNKFYAYGFSALLSKRKYNKEWLYELYKNGSSKTMFEWEYGKKPEVGLNLDSNDSNKLSTYIDDFDENAKTLFLTFMNKDKKLSQDSNLLFFNDIYSWFIENLVVCTPHTSITSFEYYYDSASLSKINELINIFDTGITNVKIEEINMDEFKNELPKPIFEDVFND
ncbi:MAG: AAA family ATPase, partial [Clostridia bacterium]